MIVVEGVGGSAWAAIAYVRIDSSCGRTVSDVNRGSDHITKDTLASLLRRIADGGRGAVIPEGLDRRTISYIHTILHRAFKDAVRWGRLARNPADAADPPRAGRKAESVRAWDATTLRSFLAQSQASPDRLHALWVVLATTGTQRGEAIGLRWADVNLETGRLQIVQTITQVRSKVTVGEPKTARGRRSISLDGGTVAMLRAHRKRMLEERLLVGLTSATRTSCSTSPTGHASDPTP